MEADGGDSFSFYNSVEGKYPTQVEINFCSGCNKFQVGFTYEIGTFSVGCHDSTINIYQFQPNEYISLLKSYKSSGDLIIYIYLKTNLDNEISTSGVDIAELNCKVFEPPDEYYIGGFFGKLSTSSCYLNQIGCIYQKSSIDCKSLNEGKFCNYNRTKILMIMPDGFFLNDTTWKNYRLLLF